MSIISFSIKISGSRWSGFGGMQDKFDSRLLYYNLQEDNFGIGSVTCKELF